MKRIAFIVINLGFVTMATGLLFMHRDIYTEKTKNDFLVKTFTKKSQFQSVKRLKVEKRTLVSKTENSNNPIIIFSFVVHANRLLNFRNVTFNNLSANIHKSYIYTPSENADMNDYSIGKVNAKEKLKGLRFPFLVKNTLRVIVSNEFFLKLKDKNVVKLHFVLTSNDGNTYEFSTNNFLYYNNF